MGFLLPPASKFMFYTCLWFCSQGRGGVSDFFPGGSPSQGSLRLCPGGSLSRGSQTLSRGGGLGPGGSLSRGVSVRGVSVRGDLCLGGLYLEWFSCFPKYLSKNCLLERINSMQWYELTRRCSPLPLMLPSPLTYVVYPWSVHCKICNKAETSHEFFNYFHFHFPNFELRCQSNKISIKVPFGWNWTQDL